MKKVVKKLLLIYVSAILIILPFFNTKVSAETNYHYYDIENYEYPIYKYFFDNNFNLAQNDLSVNYTNGNLRVIDKTTNNYVGEFNGYQNVNNRSQVCAILNGSTRTVCSDAYVLRLDYSNLISESTLYKKPIINGVYNHTNVNSHYITVTSANTYVMAFIFYDNSEYWGFPSVALEYKDNLFPNNGRVNYFMGSVSLYGGELCYIEFTKTDDNTPYSYFDINFNNWQGKNQYVTPLYLGFKNNIPYDLMKFIYGNDAYISVKDIELNNTLSNGNNETQNIIDNSNNIETDFNNTVSNYDAIENTFNNDFNNNLDNIDLSLDLNAIPKYLSAANWVSNQFNQLSSFQPVRITLQLSLILGIGLLLLGKRFNK